MGRPEELDGRPSQAPLPPTGTSVYAYKSYYVYLSFLQDVQCFSHHSEERLCAISILPFLSCFAVFYAITGLSFSPPPTTHTPVALLQISSGEIQPTRYILHYLSVQVRLCHLIAIPASDSL